MCPFNPDDCGGGYEPDPLWEMERIETSFAVRNAKHLGRRVEEKNFTAERRALDSVVTGLESASPEQLLTARADTDPERGALAKIEIQKRVERVRVVRLAVLYLTSERAAVREKAFEGLTAICYHAKDALWVPVDLSQPDSRYTGRYRQTWDFIQSKLLRILEPFRGRGETEITKAALEGKFRYLPRQIRNKIIDRIRRFYRNDGEFDRSPAPQVQGPQCTSEEMLLWFEGANNRLCTKAGPAVRDVILALVSLYPGGFGESLRESQSRISRAIAKQRGVSLQQARADKRHFEGMRPDLFDSVDAWHLAELRRISRMEDHPYSYRAFSPWHRCLSGFASTVYSE